MRTLIVIPARMASSRFPNKPMALIHGKPMIQRVWEQAVASNLGDVIVACSERDVLDRIISLGGKAILTDQEQIEYLKQLKIKIILINLIV